MPIRESIAAVAACALIAAALRPLGAEQALSKKYEFPRESIVDYKYADVGRACPSWVLYPAGELEKQGAYARQYLIKVERESPDLGDLKLWAEIAKVVSQYDQALRDRLVRAVETACGAGGDRLSPFLSAAKSRYSDEIFSGVALVSESWIRVSEGAKGSSGEPSGKYVYMLLYGIDRDVLGAAREKLLLGAKASIPDRTPELNAAIDKAIAATLAAF